MLDAPRCRVPSFGTFSFFLDGEPNSVSSTTLERLTVLYDLHDWDKLLRLEEEAIDWEMHETIRPKQIITQFGKAKVKHLEEVCDVGYFEELPCLLSEVRSYELGIEMPILILTITCFVKGASEE